MNKQELIDKLKRHLTVMSEIKGSEYDKGYNWATKQHLVMIADLDEPEKPKVPQFVVDWYEENKNDLEYNLYRLCIDFREKKLRADLHGWFGTDVNKPIETLILMHKFGYEVKKEKLYTAKLKSTGEYLHYDKDYRETRHQRVPDDVAQKCEDYHFTEDELIKYHAWENDAYEIEEVEE